MARFDPDEQAAALGEALAALRREAGLSQAEAGARIGMTSQGWGLYESGRRPGLFRPDVQRRLTGALGATAEDLGLRLATADRPPTVQASDGVRSNGRAFAGGLGSLRPTGVQRLQLSNDELAPWAASGVVLEFDFGLWPRRDQGCVIDLTDGRRLVRLYDHADAEGLYLRGGPGGLASESRIERSAVARVAAVRARLDQ
jgi:transcriptional regulator with XRE-family HTH domain